MSTGLTFPEFVAPLVWIDGRPLSSTIESYRWSIFDRAFQRRDDDPRGLAYTLILCGRAKKNWKTADLMLASFYALLNDSPGGNQVYVVANDEGQAADDLTLGKKLVRANPLLDEWVRIKANVIERRDGEGFLEILPAQDVVGSHGKTYRLLAIDEIHGYRTWDLLEALAPDPTRLDCQQWITSYASLFHRPGAPLFDLLRQAKAGTDPRLLLDWWAADFCTSADVAHLSPEGRANPSMASWGNAEYLEQQRRRLPAHKFRRLHLNLPGLPEGSAYQPEPIMDAIERGVTVRPPDPGIRYAAAVDMSGGSSDDAVLAIGHRDADDRAVLDLLIDQGQPPPFDPNSAVARFVDTSRPYRITRITGDRYAGLTFRAQFEAAGIAYVVAERTASQTYEALEPRLNSHRVVLLDVPTLEQQFLGLAWRGGKIDHQSGEHDDYACAAAGLVECLLGSAGADAILEFWRLDAAACRAEVEAQRAGEDAEDSSARAHAEFRRRLGR
jgi:hypothetical protein